MAVNKQLLEALRTPTASDPVASVSAAFSTMAPFFKAYGVYCANFVSALDHLDRLRQERPQLDEFVRRAEAAGGETVGSMLIRPVQRLCKYPLLFRELRAAVATDHPAHDALLRAEADVANTASEVRRSPHPCTLTLHAHPALSPCTPHYGPPAVAHPHPHTRTLSDTRGRSTNASGTRRGARVWWRSPEQWESRRS